MNPQAPATPPAAPQAPYEPPRIVHKGQLKHFAGSPLGGLPDGLDLFDPAK